MAEYTIQLRGKNPVRIPFKYPKNHSNITDGLDSLEYKGENISMEDIFKITLWKVDRYPVVSNDALKQLNALRTCQKLDESKTKEVLITLLKCDGVGLPMASTYLRFANPKVYQIIDTRAYRAAFDYKIAESYVHVKVEKQIEIYIKYLKQLQMIAKTDYHGAIVDFEDLDRFLYDVDKMADYKINENPEYNKEKIEESINKIIDSSK